MGFIENSKDEHEDKIKKLEGNKLLLTRISKCYITFHDASTAEEIIKESCSSNWDRLLERGQFTYE